MHVLGFLERSGHSAVGECAERPSADLQPSAEVLLRARAELHRITGRAGDRLLLQEQDAVAAALAYPTADALMADVAASAREIAWSAEETLRRLSRALDARRVQRPAARVERLSHDLGLERGEIVLLETAAPAQDATLALRAAAQAAQQEAALSRSALSVLAASAPPMPSVWPERARNALVALLGAGDTSLHVLEALDRYELMQRILPEWESVRSKPQRNAYHRFTVDRHLSETAVEAAKLVRHVSRPRPPPRRRVAARHRQGVPGGPHRGRARNRGGRRNQDGVHRSGRRRARRPRPLPSPAS